MTLYGRNKSDLRFCYHVLLLWYWSNKQVLESTRNVECLPFVWNFLLVIRRMALGFPKWINCTIWYFFTHCQKAMGHKIRDVWYYKGLNGGMRVGLGPFMAKNRDLWRSRIKFWEWLTVEYLEWRIEREVIFSMQLQRRCLHCLGLIVMLSEYQNTLRNVFVCVSIKRGILSWDDEFSCNWINK